VAALHGSAPSGVRFQGQTRTPDLAAHPLISAGSSEHRRLIWQPRIAFRRDGSEKPPAKGRKLCASRENNTLWRVAEQPLHAPTSSKGSHPGSGTDHAEQNRAGLQPEPGAFACAPRSRDG
jgi:hypothetical protein